MLPRLFEIFCRCACMGEGENVGEKLWVKCSLFATALHFSILDSRFPKMNNILKPNEKKKKAKQNKTESLPNKV